MVQNCFLPVRKYSFCKKVPVVVEEKAQVVNCGDHNYKVVHSYFLQAAHMKCHGFMNGSLYNALKYNPYCTFLCVVTVLTVLWALG